MAYRPAIWAGLLTLTALEIVLGIDNLLFLAVLVARVRAEHQQLARKLGLGLALGARLALLVGISWIAHLTQPVFTIAERGFSWRDVILIAGGLFLVYKGTTEIHARVEGAQATAEFGGPRGTPGHRATDCSPGYRVLIGQRHYGGGYGQPSARDDRRGGDRHGRHAAGIRSDRGIRRASSDSEDVVFSFLLMIGMMLVADGFGMHVPKGYIYAAISFSAGVELLNQIASRRQRVQRSAAQPDGGTPSHIG